MAAFVRVQIDPGLSPFNPGCSEGQLRRMEKILRTPLPRDYKELLRYVNGQPNQYALTFPPDELALLSAEEVLAEWEEQSAYCSDEFFEEFTSDGRVRDISFHPGRIPIARDESTTANLYIDNIPGPSGRIGQLIFNVTEADWVVVANSVTTLVACYLAALRSGAVVIEQRSNEVAEGYRFTASGRHIDFNLYDELIGSLMP
ncbi:SMI1/KNR4 family protein [Streptomyces sp. NPDC059479]|uniref:SMI1/KNR4 family protein n=1 Tax=Streptomyces sp. NPDC059479 TaxID=3346848 RepID=UPI0036976BBE